MLVDNKENNRNEEIKEILEELSSDDSTVVISESKSDGKLEFHFEGSKKSGLVFEEDTISNSGLHFDDETLTETAETEPATEQSALIVEQPEPAIEEFNLAIEESATITEEPAPAVEVDLTVDEPLIPNDAAADFDVDAVVDEPKMWTTYLPRFTEVSDTYRMNNDPRPRIEKVEKSPAHEIVDSDESLDATDESLESTAEVDAVVINLAQKSSASEEQTFSVYKFSDETSPEAPAPEVHERTVEDERAEIESLVHKKDRNFQEAFDADEISGSQGTLDYHELKEEATPKKQQSKVFNQPKNYKLPDPDEQAHVINLDASSDENPADIPSGLCDNDAGKNQKRSEFTANAQRDSIKDRFLDSIMSVKIRLVAALVLTFVLLILENLIFVGVNPAQLLGLQALPGAMAIADLQFALCIFALALPEICSASRKFIHGKMLPELSIVFSVVILSVYTIIVILENPIYTVGHTYSLFGILVAAQGLATIISTYCKRSADFIAFKRVSVVGEKKVLDIKLTRTLDRENLALDGAVDEMKSKTTRVFKTEFVTDFFKRADTAVEDDRGAVINLCVSLGSALVGAIIAFFIGDGWISAATTFAAISLLAIPAVNILVHKIPFYYSTRRFESEESAVIGESSLYDYAGVDVIALEDVDVFGHEDVSLNRIIHYGGVDNVMKAMSQMSSLFSTVGGPLDSLFENSLDRKCHPASSVTLDHDGICGKVEGHEVCAGTAEYMTRRGIDLPLDAESASRGLSDSTKVMFAAEDGVIYVQFHIRYAFSEKFARSLPALNSEKVIPLVYTRDPNISIELVKALTGGTDAIRIMKKYSLKMGEEKTFKRVSAGVVTSGDKLDAVGIVLRAKKHVKLIKKLSVASLIAMSSGCVLAAVLTILGALGISSFVFLGWQALWCLAFCIVSERSFSTNKKEVDSND